MKTSRGEGRHVVVMRRPLDNGVGSVFIAESDKGPLGHCNVFHGYGCGVYSTDLILRLQAEGRRVRQEHCVFEIEMDCLATGVALMAQVIEHAQSAGGDLVTVGLYREAYEEFFPEKPTTTWLKQIVQSAGFEAAPGTEGSAMMLVLEAPDMPEVEDVEEPESPTALPGRLIRNPGNPKRFAEVMAATADNIEALLAKGAQALAKEGYAPSDISQLEQESFTARLWAEQYTHGRVH
ncbi:hypothetical protein [Marinimicrobium sp. ABcell2]|uniref:hypothetical protein n=1 Tax=Marinimicrobium sp. ABcell2 TaxID=3069751 RepID=UPI0027B39400|nr:hypothetical protein [Marinimicrobium sp. ABcell2]MDQ2077422.1 hypothetical protein [Marinimicrobium sp. ABcell2]